MTNSEKRLAREVQIRRNVAIALFLGWKIDNSFPDKGRVYRSPEGYIELDTTFKFHESFDALMPAEIKMSEMFFGKYQNYRGDNFKDSVELVLGVLWLRVSDFCLNLQKEQLKNQ